MNLICFRYKHSRHSKMSFPGFGTELCRQADEKPPFQLDKCIICQRSTNCSVTSTENGRRKIMEASSIRRDIVQERLALVEGSFVYHMTNECYKQYTLKKTLDGLRMKSATPSGTDELHEQPRKRIR